MNNSEIERLVPFINILSSELLKYRKNQTIEICQNIEKLLSQLQIKSEDEKEVESTLWALFNNLLGKNILNKLLKNSVIISNFFLRVGRRKFLFGTALMAVGVLAFPNTVFAKLIEKNFKNIKFRNVGLIDEHRFLIYHVTAGYGDKDSIANLKRNVSVGIHYVIERDGNILPLIPEKNIAYHVGNSQWGNYDSLNKYSIGIECVDNLTGKITDKQYVSLKKLIKEIRLRYNIPKDRILPHAAVRKFKWHNSWIRGGKLCGLKISRKRIGLDRMPEDRLVQKILGRNIAVEKHIALLNKDFEFSLKPVSEKQKDIEYAKLTTITQDITPWAIAGEEYNNEKTIYLFPNGKAFSGNQIKNWNTDIPNGTRVFLNSDLKSFKRFELDNIVYYDGINYADNGQTIYSKIGPLYCTDKVKYLLDDGTLIGGEDYNDEIASKRCVIITNTFPEVYFIDKISPYSIVGNDFNTKKVVYIMPLSEEKVFEKNKKYIAFLGNHKDFDVRLMPKGTRFVVRDV